MVKNSPANVGDTGDAGWIPGLGRFSGIGNGNPLQYSCLESPMDRGAWQATYITWSHKDTDTTEHKHTHTHTQVTRGTMTTRDKIHNTLEINLGSPNTWKCGTEPSIVGINPGLFEEVSTWLPMWLSLAVLERSKRLAKGMA